jgi:hypothetical protein
VIRIKQLEGVLVSGTEPREITGAEAGLNSQRQIAIALQRMIEQDGRAKSRDIYYAVERHMNGAVLSQQGRDTLRGLMSREAVNLGLVYPHDSGDPVWRITDKGREFLVEHNSSASEALEESEQIEEPEGVDVNSFDLGDYPIDSVLIRSESRTVFEVLRRMERNQYILDPDFQRDFIWREDKQSKLIESMLMRIPLPVFYLAENDDGRIVVVDGLQRLTTFQRYCENRFALRGLSGSSSELNGRFFRDLSPKLQNRIEDTNLVLYLIDSKVPDRARLDIFERVNSGVPLSRQQMRNCLYMGQATRWLKGQAGSTLFREATGFSLNRDTMRDREAINRFCAFQLFGVRGFEKVKGDMDEFLANALRRMNTMDGELLQNRLTIPFRRSMRNNLSVFGKHAFRKHVNPQDGRNVINLALFDVYSVLLARYSEEYIATHADQIYERFFALQERYDFTQAITISTNSVRNVWTRFDLVERFYADLPADMED